jgi:hypothetical protein
MWLVAVRDSGPLLFSVRLKAISWSQTANPERSNNLKVKRINSLEIQGFTLENLMVFPDSVKKGGISGETCKERKNN